METPEPCEFLPWDSEFFGLRIGRVRASRLEAPGVVKILEWCTANAIQCLYLLADSDHAATVRLAEDNGFRLVDVRVTLEANLRKRPACPGDKGDSSIRLSRPADLADLQAIARICHTDSRFYYDGHFSRSSCDALYETWIRRSCEDYADAVLVAESEGRPVGYVSCHLPRSTAQGQIGLVGLAAEARGQGLGQRLVAGALDWFAQQGIEEVSVVTQGRNVAAQRLYQRCGFLTRSIQLWYHRWAGEAGS